MKANLPIYIYLFFLLLFLSTPLSFGEVSTLWSRLFKSPLFFYWLVMPFERTFHTRFALNSLVENSTGDVMTIDQKNSE